MLVWEEAVTKAMTRLLVLLDSVLQWNDGECRPNQSGDACVSATISIFNTNHSTPNIKHFQDLPCILFPISIMKNNLTVALLEADNP